MHSKLEFVFSSLNFNNPASTEVKKEKVHAFTLHPKPSLTLLNFRKYQKRRWAPVINEFVYKLL